MEPDVGRVALRCLPVCPGVPTRLPLRDAWVPKPALREDDFSESVRWAKDTGLKAVYCTDVRHEHAKDIHE